MTSSPLNNPELLSAARLARLDMETIEKKRGLTEADVIEIFKRYNLPPKEGAQIITYLATQELNAVREQTYRLQIRGKQARTQLYEISPLHGLKTDVEVYFSSINRKVRHRIRRSFNGIISRMK